MRTRLSGFLFLLLLTGCIPSLQPLYTEKDLVFDPSLVGTWRDSEDEATWEVRQADAKSYAAIHTEKANGESRKFNVHLLRLGDLEFLDIFPDERLGLKNETFQSHFVRAHTFYRLSRSGDRLKVFALDMDFLKRLVAEKKTAIAQISGGDVVLTGSTAQLQDFFQKHGRDSAAFTDEPMTLLRLR